MIFPTLSLFISTSYKMVRDGTVRVETHKRRSYSSNDPYGSALYEICSRQPT